jgi:hypothetical protein
MAVVNNRLVKLKLNGEPLVQFSSAFTQKFKKPTKEQQALYDDFGTNGLESYVVSKDGTVDTKGVKVKIALSENYEGLLKTSFFVDGKATADTVGVYEKKGNKYILNSKASLVRLNQMLKDEAWLNSDNNREKLLITGVRIPTQGPNSVEFAQVHEFLPASAGPIIIIPAEIVAKSGGDFDVDKLTMYMKTITKQGTLVEDKYDTPEELEPLIKAAEKKVEALKAGKLMINENLDDFRETLITESKHKKMSKQKFFDLTTYDNAALLKTLNDPAQREFLRTLYPETYAVYAKGIKDFKIEEYDEVVNQITDLFGKNSAVSKAYAELADLKFQKRKFASGIQNTLIDDIINVMKMPEMAFALMQPNDTHLAKPIADKMKNVVMKADKENNFENYTSTGEKSPGKGVSSTSLYEYDYNKKKQQDNLNGKNILGTISLGNTFSNLMNMAGASMEASYKTMVQVPVENADGTRGYKEEQKEVPLKLAFNHRKNADGTISLSSLVDAEDNHRIADILTQLMNGAVDVGKDAWVAYLQGNMQVIPKILFLLQAGTPLEDIVYFVTNPLIREYVKVQQSAGSTLSKLINTGQSGMTVTTTWLNKVLVPATKNRKDLSLEVTKDKNYKTFNTWAIYELLKEYGNKVGKKGFSKEGLEATANASLNYSDNAQIAGLLHYVYLERITEDYENLKKAINVDTNTSADTYTAQAKLEEVERARSMNTINKKIMKYVEQEGPIAPFFVQEFARDLFGRLFSLRDNEKVNKYLLNLTGDVFKSRDVRNATGFDTETLIPKFKNALAQYIFANTLRKDAVNNKGEVVPIRVGTMYKGKEISELIDLAAVTEDYNKKLYVSGAKGANTYFTRGLHPLPELAFNDLEEFIDFNLEREYLRKAIMPPTKLLSQSLEFKQMVDMLKNSGSEVYQKEEGEADVNYTKRINRAAYEALLADRALMNIYNNWSLFRSGNTTVAKKLMNMIENYPDLRLQFSLIDQFTLVSTDLPGKRTGRRNFKIKGYADLEAPLIDEYSTQWKNLADPTVPKVVASDNAGEEEIQQAAAANAYISDFFAQLPMFSFLQSGMDAGEFSMTSIMPVDRYKPIMIKAAQNFSKVLQRDDAPVILEGFKQLFQTNNVIASRKLRGRGLEWKRSLNDLLKDGRKEVASIYSDPFITKVDDKVYILNNYYSENGITTNLTNDHLRKLKADNPGVKFILSPEDMGINFADIVSSETLEKAKIDLDTFINMIQSQDSPVVITGEGFTSTGKELVSGTSIIIPTDALTEEQIVLAKENKIEQNFYDKKPYAKEKDSTGKVTKWEVYKSKNGKSSMQASLDGDRTESTRSVNEINKLKELAESQGITTGITGTRIWMEGQVDNVKNSKNIKGDWFTITSEPYTPNKADFNAYENWDPSVWTNRNSEFKIGQKEEWKSVRFERVKTATPTQSSTSVNPLVEAGVKPTDMYGNAAKDIQMAQEAIDSADGQFIGYGTVSRQGTPSSTNKYAAGWGFKANTGKYSSNSVIMVSSSGTFGRGGVSLDEEAPAIKTTFLTKYKPLLDEAVKAGASFRIGNNYEKGVNKDTSLEKIKKGEYFKGNYGDALVAEYLKAKGYTEEKLNGYSRWTSPIKSTQPSTQVQSKQPVESSKVYPDDDYKYYGRMWKIVRDETGEGVDIVGYKGKGAAKAALLEAYNINPNVDPQNPLTPFRGKVTKEESTQKEPKVKTGGDIFASRKEQIDYTPGQRKALSDIEKLIDSGTQANYLLAGYAGTGKTTIAENIARYAKSANREVLVIAPTNKAAKVLNDKLKAASVKTAAQTIHKAIYGEPDANGEWVKSAKIKNSMIIVDESSMIDKVVMSDLIDTLKDKNNIVIFMGDGFQLEQIGDDAGLFGSLNDPSIFKKNYGVDLNGSTMLTEVRRQSLDSNILKVATITRLENTVFIPENSLSDFKVAKTRAEFNRDFQESIKNKEDVIAIVATNAERMLMNNLARAARYTIEEQKKQMNKGEVLIAIANSTLYPNAETFKVSEVIQENTFGVSITTGQGQYAKTSTHEMHFTSAITSTGEQVMIANIPAYDKPSLYHAQLYSAARANPELYRFLDENELLISTKKGVKVSPDLIISTYGYAVTAHKSQGSQWDKVFVHQNYTAPTWNPARWYYTAITRAAKNVIVLPAGKNTRVNEEQLNQKIDASMPADTTLTPQSTTSKLSKDPGLNTVFSLYLSDKLKDNFGYDNPGSGAPSVDDLLTGAPVINKGDIEDKQLECNTPL